MTQYNTYQTDIDVFLAKHSTEMNAPSYEDVKNAAKKTGKKMKKMSSTLVGLILLIIIIFSIWFGSIMVIIGVLMLDRLGKVQFIVLCLLLVFLVIMLTKHFITRL
jgi:hypothetical protein